MPRRKKPVVKTFLLDTNVLMKYPNSLFGFDNNIVVVSSTSIEELDNMKNAKAEKGYQARQALEKIDYVRKLGKENGEKLTEGVQVNDNGGIVRLENDHMETDKLPQGWSLEKADNRLIAVAMNIGAILVTEDRGLSIKADEVGVEVENYKNAEVKITGDYTGRTELTLPEDIINEVMKNGSAPAGKYGKDLIENEYITAHKLEEPDKTVLLRYREGKFKKLVDVKKFGKITPKNAGQQFALDALLCGEIPLVILKGEAGTAKTFLSVVAAMYGYANDKWDQIIATRNNVEFDKGIGFLPGDEKEKVSPLLRGITDNLRIYFKAQGTAENDIQQSIDDYLETGRFSIESMGFMRGRSMANTFLILDEAQNASPKQVMGIVTRAGLGTTIVVAGDPDQIDDVTLDKRNNGLVFCAETMKGSVNCAQITFKDSECVRSDLAKDAAERMRDIAG
jgi:PhoH-like ATPase